MLMICHNVGCRVEDALHIKKIDEIFRVILTLVA